MEYNKDRERLEEILKSNSSEELKEVLKKHKENELSDYPEDRLKQVVQKAKELNPRPAAIDGRRVGNTTRLADYYIQKFFEVGNHKGIQVVDHYYEYGQHSNKLPSKLLFQTILNRLDYEHHLNTTAESRHGRLVVDYQNFSIQLLPNA